MQYDDFGNYIGPDIDSDQQGQPQQRIHSEEQESQERIQPAARQHRVVLHQDKKYYASHEEIYPGAQTLIQQEDRQALETPIVHVEVEKKFDITEKLEAVCSEQFFNGLMDNQQSIRCVTVAGHLHHGKTLVMDMLVQQAFIKNWDLEKNYRWTDTRTDEQSRLISIKSTPVSLALPDSKGKHYLLHLIDTPGHSNFVGEISCALRVSDGVLLVIDAIEGVMMMTQKILRLALKERLPVVVMVNKIDRLVLELKMPPQDAYLKIKHTLQELNGLIQNLCGSYNMDPSSYLLSPLLGNVIFGSGQYGFVFSIQSFSEIYASSFKSIDPTQLAKVFWGDYYFDAENKKFAKKGKESRKRVFVEFVLEPLYKIFSHTVGKDKPDLEPFLADLGIYFTSEQYRLNIKSFMRLVFKRYFKSSSPLVSAIANHLPSPLAGSKRILQLYYRGDRNKMYQQFHNNSRQGPLLINIVKYYNKPDCKSFDAFGKILSGTIKYGQKVKIMGQEYTKQEQQDVFLKDIKGLYLLQGRFRQQMMQIPAGNFVLIEGIDAVMTKSSTIVDSANQNCDILSPIKFWTTPVIKVALQPMIPSELPKMLDSLKKVTKSYPLIRTKVQESGQHIIFGQGELELDCVFHDIRNMFSEIEIKISDPSVSFNETVIDTSGIRCYADTANKKNRITALAGPLERGLIDSIEKEIILVQNKSHLSEYLEKNFEWDILASNNVWAFGPDLQGPNILLNDSLPTSTDQSLLTRIKPSIVQGFRWSTRQGPLCDQPIRNVKFRVIEADLSPIPIQLSAGQLIPAARRAFYSSFLTATPRMMQPIFYCEIQCTADSINAIYPLIARRRGSVISENAKAGSPLHTIKCYIPVIDSFGFETDLRVHTVGQAFCLQLFDHWTMLGGDPLDKKIVLRPLEPLQPHELAREFMIKTRRRKGLNEEVSIVKYFDDLNIKELLMADNAYKDFI